MRSERYVIRDALAPQTAAWLRELRSAIAPRPALELDPPRCALLVIDMLRYFVDPAGRCFLPAAPAIVPPLANLIATWRTQGWSVVYTQHGHAGPEELGMLGRFFGDYIRAGEPQAEILPALKPASGDLVVPKTTYDAFLGTDLERRLTSAGIEQVLVTGVLTHMCCETTARSAFCRGFEVYVAADAMATSRGELHRASLRGLADAVAVVMTTEEVLSRCANPGSPS